MRQIDPLIDCVFKAIFGDPKEKWILIEFLNDILKLPRPVVDVDILNPYSEMATLDDKQTIVDVLARDKDGRLFQIEIQLKMHHALAERMVYTWAKTHHSQLHSGKPFDTLKATYSIWILRETLTSVESDRVHLRFLAYDPDERLALSDQMQIHALQLSRWRPPAPGAVVDGEQAWLYLFKEGKAWTELPPQLQRRTLEHAMAVLKRFSQDEIEYHRYQARENWLHLQATLEQSARTAQEAREAAEEALKVAEEQTRAAEEQTRAAEEQTRAAEEQTRAAKENARAAEENARIEREARETAEAHARVAQENARANAERAARLAVRLRALGIDED